MVTRPEPAVGSSHVRVDAEVNGTPVSATVPSHRLLIDFLRDDLALTSVKRGCDVEVCGACTVLVGNLPVSACCYLAADIDGRSVETCEGLGATQVGARLQDEFVARGALQCGFCTPGMLMAACSLLRTQPDAPVHEVRQYMSGNLCRCTGYAKVVEAIMAVSDSIGERE